jgi:hypothetical protein
MTKFRKKKNRIGKRDFGPSFHINPFSKGGENKGI